MAHGPRYRVHFRRRREGRTNYPHRLKLLMSRRSRVALRGSSRHFVAQLIEYKPSGDVTLASAHSSELKNYGWKAATGNIPAAYLTGLLLGTRAKEKVKGAILDSGLQEPIINSRLFAGAKGVIEGGLVLPLGQELSEDRLSGKHIEAYASGEIAGSQFSTFKKADMAKFSEQFNIVKENILGGKCKKIAKK